MKYLKSRDSMCHHEKIQLHKCHYNACPPCNLICNKQMKCGHTCPSECHSSVLTEIIENVSPINNY